MLKHHLPARALDRLAAGELEVEELLARLLLHLGELCPTCSLALDGEETPEAPAPTRPSLETAAGRRALYGSAIARAIASTEEIALGDRRDSRASEAKALELIGLPPEERFRALERSAAAVTPDLIGHLLDGARGEAAVAGEETSQVDSLARLGLAASVLLDGERYPATIGFDYAAQFWALLAEIAVERGDRSDAKRALTAARAFSNIGTGDPLVAAQVQLGWALYHWLTDQAERSFEALEEAFSLSAAGGADHLEGLALVRAGMVARSLGRTAYARKVLERGLGLLDADRAPALAAEARSTLESLPEPRDSEPGDEPLTC